MLEQAIEATVAELEEAIFGGNRWFDLEDDILDQNKQDAEYIRNLLHEDLVKDGVKDAMAEKKGKEVAVKDLDLTGKLKMITAQKADAIGYVYWEGEELMICFQSKDGIEANSRCEHLKNTTLPFKWENIFID